jgi:hypothetical protein
VNDTAESIQWGALIVLPSGANDVEISPNRLSAILAVHTTNRTLGHEAARLVYRTAKYGPWLSDHVGDQWGVRRTWPDGHVEEIVKDSRSSADFGVSASVGCVGEVVSRTVEYGEWWVAP